MTPEELNRMLTDGETIIPSSGFTTSVMALVRQEATAPRPLAFPWAYALPGFIAFLVGSGAVLWSGSSINDPTSVIASGSHGRELLNFVERPELLWLGLACVITCLTTLFPLRLMRGRI